MEWQPIETAPTDETPILVWGGTYETDLSEPYKNDEIRLVSRSGAIWYETGGCYYASWVSNPTHWMPLPPPPTAG